MGIIYESLPIGSLMRSTSQQFSLYSIRVMALPKNVKKMLFDLKTGAFIRGSVKQFNVPLEKAPDIALTVMRVAIGEIEMAKLGATLSSELKLPNDKAQSMAREIEKELFAPVMMELNQFLEKQRQTHDGHRSQMTGVSNVVDLKHSSQNTKTKQNTGSSTQSTK